MTTEKQQTTTDLSTLITPYLPQIKRYVANRPRTAVIDGILSQGKYRVDDITDEIYIRLSENYDAARLSPGQLKITMFTLADRQLEEILAEEYVHGDDVAIEEIVAGELKSLDEKYSTQADGDLVFYEDLDDISYRNEQEQKTIFLLEPGFETDLITALDLEKSSVEAAEIRNVLACVYQHLPALIGSIVDLHTAGGLSVEEIAEVRKMNADDVYRIIHQVRIHFTAALAQ
jgi:DNA-directed RNA polymerase specialized sigma24 family protein